MNQSLIKTLPSPALNTVLIWLMPFIRTCRPHCNVSTFVPFSIHYFSVIKITVLFLSIVKLFVHDLALLLELIHKRNRWNEMEFYLYLVVSLLFLCVCPSNVCSAINACMSNRILIICCSLICLQLHFKCNFQLNIYSFWNATFYSLMYCYQITFLALTLILDQWFLRHSSSLCLVSLFVLLCK